MPLFIFTLNKGFFNKFFSGYEKTLAKFYDIYKKLTLILVSYKTENAILGLENAQSSTIDWILVA